MNLSDLILIENNAVNVNTILRVTFTPAEEIDAANRPERGAALQVKFINDDTINLSGTKAETLWQWFSDHIYHTPY